MEVFCIHEKDKVPATQESWRRCKTERRRQEPVVFVTWSKQKSRRRDWEHFRLLFERHAPSVQLELPISKWHFKGRERGNGGPPTPTPARLHQRVRPRPLRWPSEEGTRNRAADAQGGGSWARRGRAGEGDMMRARRPAPSSQWTSRVRLSRREGRSPPGPGLASCTRQVLVLGSVTLLLFPLLGVPQCEGEGRGSAPAIRRPP